MPGQTHCPLCRKHNVRNFHTDKSRRYLCCSNCALVFVPPEFHLSLEAERAEYDRHENAVDDPGYRRFLSRLAEPLSERLAAGARGLDFGCGPGPALASILQCRGYSVALYDPFYAPAEEVLQQDYDFICATEVVEHLREPKEELERLWARLQAGGILAVMTKLVRDQAAFAGWHYIRDPTHISFFSADTWRWWASCHGAALEIIGDDVMLLVKPRPGSATD